MQKPALQTSSHHHSVLHVMVDVCCERLLLIPEWATEPQHWAQNLSSAEEAFNGSGLEAVTMWLMRCWTIEMHDGCGEEKL